MHRLLLKWFVILLLFLGLATSAVLGYFHVQLRKERDSLTDRINDLNKRVSLLQKKYADEKGRASGLARTKLSLEGKLRAAEEGIETLQKEKEAILAEREALDEKVKKMEKGSLTLQAELEGISEEYEKLQAECSETKAALTQRIKVLEDEKEQLTAEKQTLGLQLDRTDRSLERCTSNNAQLCIMANELIEAYENKGVVGSILQKEPFIQLKRVEVEKFVQEYKEKIDEQQLKPQE